MWHCFWELRTPLILPMGKPEERRSADGPAGNGDLEGHFVRRGFLV